MRIGMETIRNCKFIWLQFIDINHKPPSLSACVFALHMYVSTIHSLIHSAKPASSAVQHPTATDGSIAYTTVTKWQNILFHTAHISTLSRLLPEMINYAVSSMVMVCIHIWT